MTDAYLVDNGKGWRLSVMRTSHPDARGRPVLLVPGYGMNSFIFRFHPNGLSLVDTLAARGLEVWTLDFRGQGRSIRGHGNSRYGIADLAIDDLGVAIRHVVANTRTSARTLDLVGCSLGTAMAFAHIACVPDAPIHAIVSMAGLVSWQRAHPAVRLAFGSPRLASLMRMKNTRTVARLALPVLSRIAPSLLSIYLNGESTDLSQAAKMVQTVEDPHPFINKEIAQWLKNRDLVVRGVNVSLAVPGMKHPFFCVIANDDGIVLPETSRWLYDNLGSPMKRMLTVGSPESTPIAHADLFVCNGAQERIFGPVADFLLEA